MPLLFESSREEMPPQNQNSEERKGAVKRKLEAMDTNDGASSKQAAEDVRPQVRALFEWTTQSRGGRSSVGGEIGRAFERKKMHLKAFSSSRCFDSHALLLLLLPAAFFFALRFRLPSLVLASARRGRQRRRRGARVVGDGERAGKEGPAFRDALSLFPSPFSRFRKTLRSTSTTLLFEKEETKKRTFSSAFPTSSLPSSRPALRCCRRSLELRQGVSSKGQLFRSPQKKTKRQ